MLAIAGAKVFATGAKVKQSSKTSHGFDDHHTPQIPFAGAPERLLTPSMSQTYRATVEGDRIHWHDAGHPDARVNPVEVQVVVLDHSTDEAPIARTPGVCGGEACFGAHRIPVWLVVEAWQMGWTDDEVLTAHPALRPGHLAAARSYYREHREEIDGLIAAHAAA